MRPVKVHIPGSPKSETPPKKLLELIDRYQPQPPVIRCGLTATVDGRWALYVTVPADTEIPLAAVEESGKGFPIVYEAEPDEPIRPQRA